MNLKIIDYWENFYRGVDLKSSLYPSQFAAFALGEDPDARRVIEFGCGNGRDAAFFAAYGLDVIALDASASAIELCRKRATNQNIKFVHYILGADDVEKFHIFGNKENEKTILYARFFIHAITDKEEGDFLGLARDILGPGSTLALEYRCSGDEQNKKEFGEHYRRYIQHADLCERVRKFGFEVAYHVEGKGYAKYKSEDALVGRCIAVRI